MSNKSSLSRSELYPSWMDCPFSRGRNSLDLKCRYSCSDCNGPFEECSLNCWGVYVLELERGNFYVGYSHKISSRLIKHFRGHSPSQTINWLLRHSPIKVETLEIRENLDFSTEYSYRIFYRRLEDKITLEYMSQYGWRNVRGGSWTSIKSKPPAFSKFENNNYEVSLPSYMNIGLEEI